MRAATMSVSVHSCIPLTVCSAHRTQPINVIYYYYAYYLGLLLDQKTSNPSPFLYGGENWGPGRWGGFSKCNRYIAVSTTMLGGDRVLCLDLIRYTKPGVQIHLYCGRWYWGVVMGFYSGDSEDLLVGGIRNLKLEVKPHWRGRQISVGLPAWLRQVLAVSV